LGNISAIKINMRKQSAVFDVIMRTKILVWDRKNITTQETEN
jgi:hypothetical protein